MAYSTSQLATLNFYNWEMRGRGYLLYPYTVNLEPPYKRFKHKTLDNYPKGFDDGKVPSLLTKTLSIFNTKPEPNIEQDTNAQILAKPFENTNNLIRLELQFHQAPQIDKALSLEFLDSLMFSQYPLSFELIGDYQSIKIQIVCSQVDKNRVEALFKSYFPTIHLKESDALQLPFSENRDVAICDFGLEQEFVRPLKTPDNFNIDSLTNIFASLEYLEAHDVVMLQILFKGVDNPWSQSVLASVNDGFGKSFFNDAPEMLELAKIKTAHALCATVVRIAIQSNTKNRIDYLANEMIHNISKTTQSPYNRLMPISNEGYDFRHHIVNLFSRETNRLGMLLNTQELLNLVHYPNKTINSKKLQYSDAKTKAISGASKTGCVLGVNTHKDINTEVVLNHTERLKHTHIIGVTGVGKSTLLSNMILDDMSKGLGLVLLDPHGDITDDILMHIPEHRKSDVIIIDPSDIDFPIGFNLLEAKSEIEKIVLSSDLVAAFKQHATAWGDNMTAVLSNAINTFLESDVGGTIIELKRFLLEDNFRFNYLKTVTDVSLTYYWKHEYPMVKKGIAPLLTRIDTFLRPKTLRYMFAQKQGVNFNQCIAENKIILIKLSQGLIGEENSYLLGSLFLSKINQAAFNRQSLGKEQRHPFYIYIDEFQNFITPSIISILSGARKYGVGLILAHQELAQIDDNKVLNSVLSNSFTRICFKLGDADAKKLEQSLSYFEKEDLMNLDVGEAIVRLGKNYNDFNLKTSATRPHGNFEIKNEIIEQTRSLYTKPKEDIEALLLSLLQNVEPAPKENKVVKKPEEREKIVEVLQEKEQKVQPIDDIENLKITEKQKQDLIASEVKSQTIREHTYLQKTIKRLGQQHGFVATVEKETSKGGRIDVALENKVLKIACEISVTNSAHYEVENIKKCLEESYQLVLMISKHSKHLQKIETLALDVLSKMELEKVQFIHPDKVVDYLIGIKQQIEPKTEIIKGYRVTTDYDSSTTMDAKNIKQTLLKMMMKSRK